MERDLYARSSGYELKAPSFLPPSPLCTNMQQSLIAEFEIGIRRSGVTFGFLILSIVLLKMFLSFSWPLRSARSNVARKMETYQCGGSLVHRILVKDGSVNSCP